MKTSRLPLSSTLLAAALLTGGIQLHAQTTGLVVSSNNNVGIGTANPAALLHVKGSFVPGWMQVAIQSTAADDRSGISFWNSSGVRMANFYAGNDGNSYLSGTELANSVFHIYSAGAERMTFLPSGNVGIGTANPTGEARAVEIAYSGGGDTSLKISGGTGGSSDNAFLYLNPNGGNAYVNALSGYLALGANGRGSNALTVTSSNNVGIGTTSPGYKLEIDGNGADGSALSLNELGVRQWILGSGASNSGSGKFSIVNGSNSNDAITIDGSNQVGIGTTNPQQKLQLANSSYIGIMADGGSYIPTSWNRGNAGGIILASSVNSDGSGWSYGSRIVNYDYGDGLGLSFDVNYAGSWTNDVLFVSGRGPSLGNVGIGTTNPIAQLDVGSILHVGGSTNPSLPAQGGYLGWNALNGGTGEMDFLNQQGGGSGGFAFFNSSSSAKGTAIVTIDGSGNVRANSFITPAQTYADFVFKPGYKLAPLSQVEAEIKKDGHLPGIPSEADAKAHGIDLAQMQVKLLQKIEELTLHQIEQEKLLESQNRRLNAQAERIDQLEKENTELRATR